ncbi:MAG: cobyric acid synthase, partial [Acidobacteriia bacterium]|nr:cobyric acid synthase [Terriglobia bacterium]
RMAKAAQAACLLVGDIDRGGVFASLYGTMQLLEEEERELIRGFAINKFRGDLSLLTPGVRMIEERMERPCAGVIPYLPGLGLDEEDGVAMEDRRTVRRTWSHSGDRLRVGVLALPHMSNFTDFDALSMEPSVALAYLERPEDVPQSHVLILPGTKQTLDDLDWLRRSGFAEPIHHFPGPVLGICGGMQMLGESVADPDGVEGNAREMPGLGKLEIRTVMRGEKVVRQVRTGAVTGYEIHMGETIGVPVSLDGRITGTYIHGLLDADEFRHGWIARMRAECGLAPSAEFVHASAEKEARINRLAAHVRAWLDIELLKGWLGPFQ